MQPLGLTFLSAASSPSTNKTQGTAALPSQSSSSSARDVEKNMSIFQQLKSRGVVLPQHLETVFSFFENAAQVAVVAVGGMVRCAGIFFLMGGAVHVVTVLIKMSHACIHFETMHLVIKALTDSGALPTLVSGAVMLKFGDALLGCENINFLLSTALLCFPPRWNNWTPTPQEKAALGA